MLPQGKTNHHDIEMEKLKTLNSILMKQLRESKIKINNLEDEREKLKTENLKLKDVSIDNEIRKSVIDQFLNKESSVEEIKENFLGDLQTNKEISTNNDIQWLVDHQVLNKDSFVNEIKEKFLEDLKSNKEVSTDDEIIANIFLCNICNKELKIYFHLKQNIKKVHDHGFHEEKKNFNLQPNTKIDECGNQTNANVTKRHKCHVCDKTFSTKEIRKRHIGTVHEQNNARFSCNKCDKTFNLGFLLARHLLTHLTEEEKRKRNIKCHICSKSFSRPDILKKHIKTHNE